MQLTTAVLIILPSVLPLPLPAVDSPFLAIKINREQGGIKYGYDSAVSKQAQNLVVSGKENHKNISIPIYKEYLHSRENQTAYI